MAEEDQGSKKRLGAVLQDVRKLKRNIKLRGENDPEVVAQILETIMREAITLRSYNSGRIGRGAVNELRNIRRDLVAGNIGAGGRTSEFVGKYSAVLDQIEKIELETKSEDGTGKAVISSIAQSLPSADALTAALMTANPVLGYTTKIARDLLRARGQAKSNLKSKQDERIAQLNKEQAEAENQLAEMEQNGSLDGEMQDVITRLDVIKEEIINLARIWGDNRDTNLEQVDQAEETNSLLEKVSDDNEQSTSSLEKISALEQERTRKERSDKGQSRLKQREIDYEQGAFTAGSSGLVESKEDSKGLDFSQFGLMSGLGGAIGAMVTKIFAPFKWLFGFLLKGGLVLGKFAAIGGLIISAVNGIAGMFDGLFNAAEVLGKSEDEPITLFDRFRAAQAGFIAGLLSPINWLLDQFGLGFAEDEQEIRDTVVKIQEDVIGFVDRLVNSITNFFTIENFETNILPSIESLAGSVGTMLISTIDSLSESIFGISVTDMIQKVKDVFTETIDKITGIFKKIFDDIIEWGEKKYESITGGISKGIESAKDTVSGAVESTSKALSETKDSVLGFFGFGKDEETTKTRESLEEDKDARAARALQNSNRMLASFDEKLNSSPMTIVAPSNVTNVKSTNVEMSTGARNNDNSLARVNQRNMMYRW